MGIKYEADKTDISGFTKEELMELRNQRMRAFVDFFHHVSWQVYNAFGDDPTQPLSIPEISEKIDAPGAQVRAAVRTMVKWRILDVELLPTVSPQEKKFRLYRLRPYMYDPELKGLATSQLTELMDEVVLEPGEEEKFQEALEEAS